MTEAVVLDKKIGLIAGSGQFPFELIKAAKNKGIDIDVVAHIGETDPGITDLAAKTSWVKVGQIGKIIKFFKQSDVKQAIFLGGIKRVNIFSIIFTDLIALKILANMRSFRDDEMLRAITNEIEKEGIKILSPACILDNFLIPAGMHTKKSLTKEERASARLGWEVAEKIGQLDIGQTIIVKDRIVVAVEAIEGTDSAIKRAGEIAGKGTVVVKIPKQDQDMRLDIPSIGLKTIESLKTAGASVLVLKAKGVMVLEPHKVFDMADKAGISIVAYNALCEI